MIVSFDFDNTLTKPTFNGEFWRPSLDPNPEVVLRAKEIASEGHDVIIVTSRSPSNLLEVHEFVVDNALNIQDVHATDNEWKVHKLEELGVYTHFDDDFEELERLQDSSVNGKLVVHPFDKEEHPDKIEQFDKFK
jgi:hypothetical protein